MPASASGLVERTVPSVRRQSGAVKTSSVGRFATWKMPSTVSPPPPIQRAPGRSPTVRSVPGPLKLDRVEGVLVELPAARHELLAVRPPGSDGIRLVEAHRSLVRRPQPLDVRLAEHLLRLAGGRVGGDRPVDGAGVLRRELRFERLDRAGLPDPARIEVREQLRLGIACDHDQCVAVEGRRARELPWVRVGQVLFRRVLDERAANVRVAVQDVDEPGAGAIPGFRSSRASGAWSSSALTRSVWPGWRFVPTRTIRSA